jgi:hypothetical protein
LTELSYVKGATSSLQTQLTAKPNKNYIMNPSCNISQRGDGPWNNPNNNFMIVDGWRYMKSLTGTAPVAISYLRSTLTAGLIYNTSRAITRQIYLGPMTLNANDYEYFQRKIEQGCRMLCGASKTVTLSFWAWADSNAPKIGIALVQEYGTGGSASEIINGTTITLSTTPTRYSYTFTTNTLSGKTLSTSLDDSLTTRFYYCWGTGTHSAYVGSTGVANMPSDFINITNVKLEMGSVMTEYVPNTISEDITECLRFYEQLTFTAGMILGNGWAGTTTKAYWEFYFVKKRLVPPFIGLYSTTDGIFIRRADGTNVSSTATDAGFTNASFDSCQFTTTVASGLTAGEGIGSYVATGKSVTIEIQADF